MQHQPSAHAHDRPRPTGGHLVESIDDASASLGILPGPAAWRLKSGYRENLSRATWEGEAPGTYWHAERTTLSAHYQFDVYLRARQLALEYGATSLLDVGSGPGKKAATLFCDVVPEVVLVDQPTARPLVSQYCPSATFVDTDLEDISLDWRRAFDVIVCADVIEHLIDPTSCLAFIRRHAGPHTWIVLSTVERDYARGVASTICDKVEHVREWNGAEFAEALSTHGFRVVRHSVCPTLRDEDDRGHTDRFCIEPFTPRPAGPTSNDPDMTRSCQICECRIAPTTSLA